MISIPVAIHDSFYLVTGGQLHIQHHLGLTLGRHVIAQVTFLKTRSRIWESGPPQRALAMTCQKDPHSARVSISSSPVTYCVSELRRFLRLHEKHTNRADYADSSTRTTDIQLGLVWVHMLR